MYPGLTLMARLWANPLSKNQLLVPSPRAGVKETLKKVLRERLRKRLKERETLKGMVMVKRKSMKRRRVKRSQKGALRGALWGLLKERRQSILKKHSQWVKILNEILSLLRILEIFEDLRRELRLVAI
jgi:hypothetical protein